MASRLKKLHQLRYPGAATTNVLPPSAIPRKLATSAYSTVSSKRTFEPVDKGNLISSADRAILSRTPVLAIQPGGRNITQRRYQHSQPEEQPIELDHAPILKTYPQWIRPQDTLPRRHIGPSDEEIAIMLKQLNQSDLEAFIRQTIPDSIRTNKEFTIPSEQTPETEMLDELTKAGKANSAAEVDTYIGMGYHPTITPGVIKRNVLENPGWYTSYTPYQPEISQGTLPFVIH